MRTEYCIDYLSHQWKAEDLIQTYSETRKQFQKYFVDNSSSLSLLIKNEKKMKKSERYKLLRFQNALWREMARKCTSKLSEPNTLIHPSTVSWQKESDITWLYGPMYTSNSCESHSNKYNVNVEKVYNSTQQVLKPVLKKQSSITQQQLPNCSDPLLFYFDNTNHRNWTGFGIEGSAITSGRTSSRSSFSSVSSSVSSKLNIGVHFNPEIIEIQYQPECPVSTTEPISTFDNEEEEDDDAIWSLIVHIVSLGLKIPGVESFLYNVHYSKKSKGTRTCYYDNNESNEKKAATRRVDPKKGPLLVNLMTSVIKSLMSLTTAWILWQSLSPLSWLYRYKGAVTTAGQSSSKKLL